MTDYCAKCGTWAPLDMYAYQCTRCIAEFYSRPVLVTPGTER